MRLEGRHCWDVVYTTHVFINTAHDLKHGADQFRGRIVHVSILIIVTLEKCNDKVLKHKYSNNVSIKT